MSSRNTAGSAAAVAVFFNVSMAIGAALPEGEHHGFAPVVNAPEAVGVYERAGKIRRIYGPAFAHGLTAEASAVSFLQANAGMLDAEFGDLALARTQPMMYDRDAGTYKFTGVFFDQRRDGVPVFRGEVRLLVRNESGYPLVLASNALRPLDAFRPQVAARAVDAGKGIGAARAAAPRLDNFTAPQLVIWAGVDDVDQPPRLAHTFIGDDTGGVAISAEEKWLFVTDAGTGEVLYMEDQILEVDVAGTVEGLASEGQATAECEPESAMPMPYARVSIGGTFVYADANGDFVVPNGGAGPVTVETGPRGQFFRVFHQPTGGETVESQVVSPPGPVTMTLNPTNTEFTRAEVNAYLSANQVRDFALFYNPAYPIIGGQTEFSITVNEPGPVFCPGNAQYQGDNMRFCAAEGNTPNTAWNSVVYHEYGHHLVQVSGSGQGQYGEGMGDVVSNIILDDPGTGYGFFGSDQCETPLRTAENTMQYPCSGEEHFCGTLISACVWDLRNELLATNPSTYYDLVADLALNSILLHTGSTISPDITIDYLTLDDNDANIMNGTPHYGEINAAFSAHNMPAPEPIGFEFPGGVPTLVAPGVATVVAVNVVDQTATAVPGTGMLHYSISGGPETAVAMAQIAANEYEAVLPALACGETLSWWVSAESSAGTVTEPSGAPAESFMVTPASAILTNFEDDFETDQGWAVTDTGGLTDGSWDVGVPINCDRGDPPTDGDGSGQCYLTDNDAANNCNSDVDNGTTILTSPTMDATGGVAVLSYHRWYDNTFGADPANDIFVVEVSDDDGASWRTLEVVGPGGSEVVGGWYYREFTLNEVGGLALNDQFRVRFAAQDINSGSVVEAAVDGVSLRILQCEDPVGCAGDLTGPEGVADGNVDALDFLLLIGQWGSPCAGSCTADVTGPEGMPDGNVDSLDFLLLIGQWGSPANCAP